MELVVDSPGKRKTNSENQEDLEMRERNEGQYDKETLQKEQDNISEILINNKEMENKEMIGNY